jgi:hypothetical protein
MPAVDVFWTAGANRRREAVVGFFLGFSTRV